MTRSLARGATPRPAQSPLALTETLPPEKLTTSAQQAVDWAPVWLRKELRDNMSLMDTAHQDTFAQMILNPSDIRYTDEIAFCIAETDPELLQSADFTPGIIEENVRLIYEHEQYLDYVQIVDVGAPGQDDDYFSTTRYLVEENGVQNEYDLPQELYYWLIVHPKIEDEPVDYCDPDTEGAPHAAPPLGVFWRDWLFTYTEPKPGSDDDFPILRDRMAGVPVLWKSKVNDIDNGAIGAITQWVLEVMQFTSGVERPHQPVRIYKLHMGRCGEYQDFTSAAARACLIPCLNVEAVNEDHVWNEFWDRRYIHWEPVNTYIDSPLTYENGWGKVFSGIVQVFGDGYSADAVERYSEGHCQVTVQVTDANGDPIDGAKILFRTTGGFPGDWGYTDSTGTVVRQYGDQVACSARITSDIGSAPDQGYYTIVNPTADGASYFWQSSLSGTLPAIHAQPASSPSKKTTNYRLAIQFEVAEEVLWGAYQYDNGNHYSRRVPTGSVDSFIVDLPNWEAYAAGGEFVAHEINWFKQQNEVAFDIPAIGTWTAVISAERKLKCKQAVDVSAQLEQLTDEGWQTVSSLNRTVELAPGERYAVSAEIPPDLGVVLSMPATNFSPGDECGLTAELGNPGEEQDAVPLFVVCDVYGLYFFYPTWHEYPELSYETVALPAGLSNHVIIPSFAWPRGAGAATGLYFYGAMTTVDFSALYGGMGTWEFSYRE